MYQSQALALLTTTYTDSEGEEEEDIDVNVESQGSVTINTPNVSSENKSASTSRPTTPIPARVTAKVAKLVSYHDDTVVSDDEGEADEPGANTTTTIIEKETVATAETIEDDGIQLPPEPPGHCSSDLQDKIHKLHEKMQNSAFDMNNVIQQRKDFRNPSIYEKLIQFCGINEFGTNYSPEIFEPLQWSKESSYEELANAQNVEMRKIEKERQLKIKVMSETRKSNDDAKKQNSKSDKPAIKLASLVQPPLTCSATGTRRIIISAFGSLPKKRRPWRK